MIVRQNLIRILLFGFFLKESAADFLNRFPQLIDSCRTGVLRNRLRFLFLTFRFGNLILLIGVRILCKRFRRNCLHRSSRLKQHAILKFEDFDFFLSSHDSHSFLLEFSDTDPSCSSELPPS